LNKDTLNWHSHVRVDKWSYDQWTWAENKSGLKDLQGWQLREILGTGPDEVAEADGNLLTYTGLAYLWSIVTGVSTTTSSAAMAYGFLPVGVGDGSGSVPTAAVTDSDLTATVNRYYNPVDAGYPIVGAAGSTAGILTVQSTFTTAIGNYAWNEWGLYGTIAPFSAGQTSKPTTATMINHKGVSLGTKSSSNVWTLASTITLS
jgi:hypothetical protein